MFVKSAYFYQYFKYLTIILIGNINEGFHCGGVMGKFIKNANDCKMNLLITKPIGPLISHVEIVFSTPLYEKKLTKALWREAFKK